VQIALVLGYSDFFSPFFNASHVRSSYFSLCTNRSCSICDLRYHKQIAHNGDRTLVFLKISKVSLITVRFDDRRRDRRDCHLGRTVLFLNALSGGHF